MKTTIELFFTISISLFFVGIMTFAPMLIVELYSYGFLIIGISLLVQIILTVLQFFNKSLLKKVSLGALILGTVAGLFSMTYMFYFDS